MTEEEMQASLEEERKRHFPDLMDSMWTEDGLHDKSYLRFSFEDDDQNSPKISSLCQNYADNWAMMKENNIGLLLYGNVGSGKSFFASCVGNAVLGLKSATVCATSFTRILNCIQSSKERQALLDRLGCYKLLLLDDLGSERTTEFMQERECPRNCVTAQSNANRAKI